MRAILVPAALALGVAAIASSPAPATKLLLQDRSGIAITAAASVNAGGMAPGFSTQFRDVEVGLTTIVTTIWN